MKVRIDGWCNRVLSQGEKEVFIKAVLQAIPTYTMSYFLMPKSFCKEIESLMANFWCIRVRENRESISAIGVLLAD